MPTGPLQFSFIQPTAQNPNLPNHSPDDLELRKAGEPTTRRDTKHFGRTVFPKSKHQDCSMITKKDDLFVLIFFGVVATMSKPPAKCEHVKVTDLFMFLPLSASVTFSGHFQRSPTHCCR